MTTATHLIGIVLLLTAMSAARAVDADLDRAAIASFSLTPEQCAALEAKVAADADDAEDRAKLLGAYLRTRPPARADHVLWFIEHMPESHFASMPFVQLDRTLEADAYARGAALWRKQVDATPTAAVLKHAASYFFAYDAALAEQLLRRGLADFPKDPEFPEQLARLLGHQGGADALKEASALTEQSLALTTDERKRFYLLSDAAKNALHADDRATAKAHADELLRLAGTISDWNTGNAIHDGNEVLGLLALRDGDIKAADGFLLAAGATKGSPQLDSFGPNMQLAKELLDRGEKDTVLQYFDLCAKFWKDDRLARWGSDVRAGRAPDFGANLAY